MPLDVDYGSRSTVESAEVAGAPVNFEETEFTPEIIVAGVEELSSFNLDFESGEEAVIRIYRRMQLVARGLQHG
jgi:hypothetical protein